MTRTRQVEGSDSTVAAELEAAGDRSTESAERDDKKRNAELFSHALAKKFATDLRQLFGTDSIKAGESRAGAARGAKKLDVNYSDDLYGLRLGISIKTILHRDAKSKNYTKNRKRVDEEFLAEVLDYHLRQPYAVLIGVYFLPLDGCDDGTPGRASSFGQWVEKLFERSGRRDPRDNPELFERVFIGLFESRPGPSFGHVTFFDVQTPPPRTGRPAPETLLSWSDLIEEIAAEHAKRNERFRWAQET